jgi:hypothetical protein
MALPTCREAQPFYQAAMQRFEDAKFLLRGKRTTAAVYLGGCSIHLVSDQLCRPN